MNRAEYYARVDELLKEYEIVLAELAFRGKEMTFREYNSWLDKKYFIGHKLKDLYNDLKPEKFI